MEQEAMEQELIEQPPQPPVQEKESEEAAKKQQEKESKEAEEKALQNEQEAKALQLLWEAYSNKVLPAEKISQFGHFCARPITVNEFKARPQVLLVGQYSTGKTSMVRWLTGRNSGHFDVRPQPSTDKFMAVVHGPQERLIKGGAAACLHQLPYQGLADFGADFLDSFTALTLPAPRLDEVTLIDTPGVLAGLKQRGGRSYDFASICGWLAERADLVLLTFDAHKLDLSDEFQEVMEVLRPFADKVRCVLNKADQIDASNLVRVYGALLWNVGKVLRTPEVTRVYVSSFWDEPYRFKDHQQLFEEDKTAILDELGRLPQTALLRKTHTVVARVRRARAHYFITTYLKSQIPLRLQLFRAKKRKARWLERNLARLFDEAKRLHTIPAGDMPNFQAFQNKLSTLDDVNHLPTWQPEVVRALDEVIETDAPKVMDLIGGVSPFPESTEPSSLPHDSNQGFFQRLGCCSKRARAEGGDEEHPRRRRRLDP